MFGLMRRSKETKPNAATHTLADAALQALDVARRERWALLSIATLNGQARAQHWFAGNLLEIVSVQGCRREATQSETLTRDLRKDLTLTDDIDGLAAAGEDETRFVDLRVAHTEFKKYLAWARTVQ